MQLSDDQKAFIKEKLIPFISREQGHGFAMDVWHDGFRPVGQVTWIDGVEHQVPKCGTICCIGGSVQALTVGKLDMSWHDAAKKLGLSKLEGERLFFERDEWPAPFADEFESAETPTQKAKVACELLYAICEKGTEILGVGDAQTSKH